MGATSEVDINLTEARKGKIYLWLAIFIFGAAASVVAKLVQIGAESPIDGRNPISFCNLLFVGNVVAGLTLLIYSYKEWRPVRAEKTESGNSGWCSSCSRRHRAR